MAAHPIQKGLADAPEVREEIELLKRQFPDLQHGDQLDWVLILELVSFGGAVQQGAHEAALQNPGRLSADRAGQLLSWMSICV